MSKKHENIFLIHGIRAKDIFHTNMDVIKDMLGLKKIKSKIIYYGYVLLPTSNRKAVKETTKVLRDYKQRHENEGTSDIDNIVVGYSNGAWTAVQVAENGCDIDRLVLISPALHQSHAFPEKIKSIDVFYCEEDYVLWLAKLRRLFRYLLPWLWDEPIGWGEMGRVGYVGDDPRVTNHRMPDETKHKFYKDKNVIEKIVDVITRRKNETD